MAKNNWTTTDLARAACEIYGLGSDYDNRARATMSAAAGRVWSIEVETAAAWKRVFAPWSAAGLVSLVPFNAAGISREDLGDIVAAFDAAKGQSKTIRAAIEDGKRVTLNLGTWLGAPRPDFVERHIWLEVQGYAITDRPDTAPDAVISVRCDHIIAYFLGKAVQPC